KQNNNTNKKTKPGKSWCPATFELTTSTTNLAGHLRTEHRLNQTGLLSPLNSKRETTQLQPVKLDSSQPTLLELVTCKPFNILANERFQNILYEAEPQYQFLCKDIFKQKMFSSI
ncbi:24149_t:CDS:2, partial [Gigaspora rosea]